jgi:predicted Zn-dependent peptidase
MSSRLFQNIREKQWLCYYINAHHYTSPDDGVFVIRAWIDKERFDFGLEKIYAEIADIATWDFDEQEFMNAINATIWWLQIGIETSDDVSTFLGMQQLLYNDIISLEEKVHAYKNVSYQQVKSVAKNLLDENLYLYYIK